MIDRALYSNSRSLYQVRGMSVRWTILDLTRSCKCDVALERYCSYAQNKIGQKKVSPRRRLEDFGYVNLWKLCFLMTPKSANVKFFCLISTGLAISTYFMYCIAQNSGGGKLVNLGNLTTSFTNNFPVKSKLIVFDLVAEKNLWYIRMALLKFFSLWKRSLLCKIRW